MCGTNAKERGEKLNDIEIDWMDIKEATQVTTDKKVEVKSEIDLEIETLRKKISELESKKTLEKFVKIPIQRNMQLLKHLFDNMIKDDGFICGGFGRVSVSKNEEVIPSADIDIYCRDKEAFERISKRLEMNGYFEKRKSK